MNLEKLDLTVRDLVAGCHDDGGRGVRGYDCKLDCRLPYQRDHIYQRRNREKASK